MPLKVYRGFVAFDDDDDLLYSPFYNGAGAPDALSREIYGYRCLSANPRLPNRRPDLRNIGNDAQIFIWAHGNRTRAGIADDAGQTLGAKEIVRDLETMRLPAQFAGAIILWTCFGGVPGGFGESLRIRLSAKGYQAADLYGPLAATGPRIDFPSQPGLRYKGLTIYDAGGTAPLAGSLEASVAPSVANGLPGWNGVRRFAQPSDLRRITARMKAAEV